eukprot:TRINITY_DN18727_c0_g1_i1.p1 TRINITY_DN18727_c0_g1~~TRINITY_DN18727_c0_g1_i1.p1  ORF type:complete len:183 (+),score=43.87 TRINITY_DN18727_c0_g1_i1:153-701(+)
MCIRDRSTGGEPTDHARSQMPKVVKPRKRVQRLANAAAQSVGLQYGVAEEASEQKKDAVLSRGQKRRQEKRERVMRKFTMKHPKDQDGEEFGYFGALASSIDDVEAAMKPSTKPTVMTKKKKTTMLQAEMVQFSSVLSHPSFQANPLDTLQLHLQSVVSARNVQRQEDKGKGSKGKSQAKAQ